MTRWLWIALAIGCSGDDKDATGTDTDGTGDTDETFDTDGARCQPVDPIVPVVAVLTPVIIEFEGNNVLYGMPDSTPTGVVVYFHGAGGTAGDFSKTEQQALMNQLAPFGWGYVAAESEDQEPGHLWETTYDADNTDMARVVRALEHVASLTSLEADTPIVAMGFSNGGSAVGAFVDIYADELPIVAASFHNTNGAEPEGMPTIWIPAENDPKATPAQMENSYEDLLANGEQSEYYLHEELTLMPEMLQRNPELVAEEANVVFADMVASGLVDADGTRLVQGDGDSLDKTLTNWAEKSAAPGAVRGAEMLRVIWALHRFSGYQAQEECAFLTGIVNQP